jgi:hypothetical protein
LKLALAFSRQGIRSSTKADSAWIPFAAQASPDWPVGPSHLTTVIRAERSVTPMVDLRATDQGGLAVHSLDACKQSLAAYPSLSEAQCVCNALSCERSSIEKASMRH